jgi:purine nucleosidase
MDARRFLLSAGATATTIVCLLALSLALPVPLWRTGEHSLPPLKYRTLGPPAVHDDGIWIDTDPACGSGRYRDPDDCIALVSLLTQQRGRIAGIATVFGNAELDTTDAIARELVDEAGADGRCVKVWRDCAHPLPDCSRGRPTEAHEALRSALRSSALSIVALGPLTNLAGVLQDEPELARAVVRVIAVMGRRPGHMFHPSEGRGEGAMLFGHGPIFRDLNAELDPDAVEIVLRAGVPLVLVPYAAARDVVLQEQDLEFLAAQGRAGAWTAARSREWLDFWQSKVGMPGFYPFDLLAAAVLHASAHFRCADVLAWVGRDPMFVAPRTRVLLVGQSPLWRAPPRAVGTAIYCDAVTIEPQRLLSR